MKEAYIKAINVIMSCETPQHILAAYNYIHNFRILYGRSELTERLMERCALRRTMIDEKI